MREVKCEKKLFRMLFVFFQPTSSLSLLDIFLELVSSREKESFPLLFGDFRYLILQRFEVSICLR